MKEYLIVTAIQMSFIFGAYLYYKWDLKKFRNKNELEKL